MRKSTSPVFFLAILLAACTGDKGGDTDSGTSPGGDGTGGTSDGTGGDDGTTGDDGTGDDGTGDDGGTTPDAVSTVVSGTVRVELFYLDSDGGRVSIDFDEAWDGIFPYGSIFIGAYTSMDDDGTASDWHGDQKIASPTIGGDPFEVDVSLMESGEVYMYAQLDQWGDGILGSSDPYGVNSDPITIVDGESVDDVEIVILVEVEDPANEGGGDGGGSGGSTCSTIDGTLTVASGWDSGEAVVAMLYDSNGYGPYEAVASSDMAASGDEATGTWAMSICSDYGSVKLLGAHDSNANGLIDPADTWGAYVTAPDEDGNPIDVDNTTDQTGLAVQVPLNGGGQDDQGISLVPFVAVKGDLSVRDGTFDDLPPGSTAWVVALKYRPVNDISVATVLAYAYDYETWDWSELSGQTSKSWRLGVPASTTVYLWAYVDTDGDGIVNEVDEAVASAGETGEGAISTGTTTQTYDLALDVPGGE